jgi:hypothetical protein
MAPADGAGSEVVTPKSVGRKACNGFFSKPEIETIVISDEFISLFSLPQEALTYEPPTDLVIYKFKSGDKERKLHCNCELNEAELNQLKNMQQLAIQQNLEFYPSITVSATRYISRARGDVKKALNMMKDTQEWKNKYFEKGPIVAREIAQDLELGFVYFVGRDKELRPTLVCRANRIPQVWIKEKQVHRLIKLVIFCMEYMVRYMCLSGKIEGLNLIVDLKGLTASQISSNIEVLKKIYEVTNNNYSGRTFKIYLVNLSSWLSVIMSTVKSFLTDRQKQKIVTISKLEDFFEDFAHHQLEEDHGGSRPLVTKFFPFPLATGPFEAGCSKGPKKDPVPRVDMLLTPQNYLGRLWDPKKTREENIRVDFPIDAIEVFKKCSVPVPEHLAQKERKQTLKKEARFSGSQTAASLNVDAITNSSSPPFLPQGGPPVVAAKVADTPTSCLPQSPAIPLAAQQLKNTNDEHLFMPGMVSLQESEEDEGEHEVIYQDSKMEPELTNVEVTPTSWFGCTACRCCTNDERR